MLSKSSKYDLTRSKSFQERILFQRRREIYPNQVEEEWDFGVYRRLCSSPSSSLHYKEFEMNGRCFPSARLGNSAYYTDSLTKESSVPLSFRKNRVKRMEAEESCVSLPFQPSNQISTRTRLAISPEIFESLPESRVDPEWSNWANPASRSGPKRFDSSNEEPSGRRRGPIQLPFKLPPPPSEDPPAAQSSSSSSKAKREVGCRMVNEETKARNEKQLRSNRKKSFKHVDDEGNGNHQEGHHDGNRVLASTTGYKSHQVSGQLPPKLEPQTLPKVHKSHIVCPSRNKIQIYVSAENGTNANCKKEQQQAVKESKDLNCNEKEEQHFSDGYHQKINESSSGSSFEASTPSSYLTREENQEFVSLPTIPTTKDPRVEYQYKEGSSNEVYHHQHHNHHHNHLKEQFLQQFVDKSNIKPYGETFLQTYPNSKAHDSCNSGHFKDVLWIHKEKNSLIIKELVPASNNGSLNIKPTLISKDGNFYLKNPERDQNQPLFCKNRNSSISSRSSNSSSTLQSPVVVKEVMKKMTSSVSSQDQESETIHKPVEKPRNVRTISKEELLVIQELERSIDEASRGSLTNKSKSHSKLYIKAQKRKESPSKGSSGPSSLEQQMDNLVEEIYLTPDASLPVLTNNICGPPKETTSSGHSLATSSNIATHLNITCPSDEVNRASVSSLDSGTSSHNQTHFVVVAVDFGTTYSGYAFCFTRDPSNVHTMRKWDGGGNPDLNNHKTPTTLLLSPDGEFKSFGFAARNAYHNLSPKDAKKWLYFEKFKMTLHKTETLSRDTQIVAANGASMSALTVFAHALRYFKSLALEELSNQCGTDILDEDVRWVVTVPAIWKQPAKQFMRNAAYEASMGSPQHPEQLLIALEPEAASIYCRSLKLNQLIPERRSPSKSISSTEGTLRDRLSTTKGIVEEKGIAKALNSAWQHHNQSNSVVDDEFSKGTRYMVVDCGGGTVDITVHEIQNKEGSLKELYKATGGPHGSIGVDKEFENLLEDIFGTDFIEHYKQKFPAGYVDLMTAFEATKRAASTHQETQSNISPPFSFINAYKKFKGQSVEAAIKKYDCNEIRYCSKGGILRLQPSLVRKLFNPVTREIVNHIKSVMDHHLVGKLGYLFLVGGFSESQILQDAVRKAFEKDDVRVIIPQGTSLAILRGAVLFGLDPTVISVRRSRMTYGIGVLNKFIHGRHPLSKRRVQDGIEWCSDVFDKFVRTDESVPLGEIVTRSYTPAKDGQTLTVLHIFCSEKDDPEFITDDGVQKCGTLILDLSNSPNKVLKCGSVSSSDGSNIEVAPTRREIQTQMTFGDTEIKVKAVDVTTGNYVLANLDFLSQ